MPESHVHHVEAFRNGLDPETLATVDALRALIAATDARLHEGFKWNAPSFRLGTDHCVTLGLERKGGVRVVLHRGVLKKDAGNFNFDDPDRLAVWPSKDRGILIVRSLSELQTIRHKITDLVCRWLAAVAS